MSKRAAGNEPADPGGSEWSGEPAVMQEGPEGESVTDASYEALLRFIGARVRTSRRLAKLSQKELARVIRSGQSYIVQIEAGQANITLKTLMRIAAAVDLPLRDFLPQEQPDQVAQALHTAMQNLDRASEQLQHLHKLVVDDPHAPASDKPPRS